MNFECQQFVVDKLGGERLLWCDKPNPQKILMNNLKYFFIAIPWTLFAVGWVALASLIAPADRISEAIPLTYFSLFGTPFVLVGIFIFFYPVIAYFKAFHTVYAFTEQRCMIINKKNDRVKSYSIIEIEEIMKKVFPDGSGNLFIHYNPQNNTLFNDGNAQKLAEKSGIDLITLQNKLKERKKYNYRRNYYLFSFIGISDAESTERLLWDTKNRIKSSEDIKF